MNCFPICMSMIKANTKKPKLFCIRSVWRSIFAVVVDVDVVVVIFLLNVIHQYVGRSLASFILNNLCIHNVNSHIRSRFATVMHINDVVLHQSSQNKKWDCRETITERTSRTTYSEGCVSHLKIQTGKKLDFSFCNKWFNFFCNSHFFPSDNLILIPEKNARPLFCVIFYRRNGNKHSTLKMKVKLITEHVCNGFAVRSIYLINVWICKFLTEKDGDQKNPVKQMWNWEAVLGPYTAKCTKLEIRERKKNQ